MIWNQCNTQVPIIMQVPYCEHITSEVKFKFPGFSVTPLGEGATLEMVEYELQEIEPWAYHIL